jgi:hypothetical protein
LIECIKWANFNHEKQGQFTDKSKVSTFGDRILSVGTFRMGEEVNKIFETRSKEIQVLIGRENSQLRQEAKKQ